MAGLLGTSVTKTGIIRAHGPFRNQASPDGRFPLHRPPGGPPACYACPGPDPCPPARQSDPPLVNQTMTLSETWKGVFTNWPAGIPHRGVLVNTLNEATPFKGFMIKADSLLLERTNPDSLGARFIVMGFDSINSL